MTPLDFDLFRKIHYVTGVTPDFYETVLMVDADTKVDAMSLRLMTNTMHNEPNIMGLCGETKIGNKNDSWVTRIQIFEYYISHHLGKAFESVFGCVTCTLLNHLTLFQVFQDAFPCTELKVERARTGCPS